MKSREKNAKWMRKIKNTGVSFHVSLFYVTPFEKFGKLKLILPSVVHAFFCFVMAIY